MDEDMGDLYLSDLDLLGLEYACKKNTFHTITPKEIHLLKEVFHKDKLCGQLGIQNKPPADLKKAIKNLKKHGCKIDLQCIASLGSRLVDLGQYTQLIELFSSNTQGSQ
jgi:hypothetical protein